jgi:hypothetical protein
MPLIRSDNLGWKAGGGGGTCTQTTGDNAADATRPLQPAWKHHAADLNELGGERVSP